VSEYAITLPALPSMVGVARHAVAAILGDDAVAEDVARIVSEFATNAVRHATGENGGSFVLSIVALDGLWRVAVDGPGTATSWEGQDGDFGRGLVIVDALADRWGTDVHEDGFVWWAELWR
jgi:anti-sigma regulatory factor (Ser/Thr protein kinase)